MPTKSTAAYKPTVRLTAHRGWYRVQSGTNPDVYYDTTAHQCSCPARKPCRHMTYVRGLNIAFYVKPATSSTDLDQRLAQAYRALIDAHEQSDERAVLMRQVDKLERQVAAANASAMRAA